MYKWEPTYNFYLRRRAEQAAYIEKICANKYMPQSNRKRLVISALLQLNDILLEIERFEKDIFYMRPHESVINNPILNAVDFKNLINVIKPSGL